VPKPWAPPRWLGRAAVDDGAAAAPAAADPADNAIEDRGGAEMGPTCSSGRERLSGSVAAAAVVTRVLPNGHPMDARGGDSAAGGERGFASKGRGEWGAASPSPVSRLLSAPRVTSAYNSAGDTGRLRDEARCAGVGGDAGEAGEGGEAAVGRNGVRRDVVARRSACTLVERAVCAGSAAALADRVTRSDGGGGSGVERGRRGWLFTTLSE
jgi:hypothetical protein